jgi:DHA3 family macrolide efflux protein-like MFS transporter
MGLMRRYAGFRALWVGQLLSQMGNAIFLIMGLWEIQLRSPFLLAIAGLAMTIPASLGVVGGALIDRYDPRRLMLWTDTLRGVAVLLGLLALAIPHTLILDIMALLAVNSLGSALFGPAESVILPWLVKDEDLGAANGLYSVTSQLSSAIGSALGGAAIAAIGIAVVFGLDLASFWLSALAIFLMMRVVARPVSHAHLASTAAPFEGLGQSILEGWRGLGSMPWLVRLIPIILITNLAFSAAFTMLPYWSRQVLHGDAFIFGILEASWAVGMVVGSVGVSAISRFALNTVIAVTGAALGLGAFAFAISPWPSLSIAILIGTGAANGIANALLFTLMQRAIPEQIRGRAFGLLISVITISSPVGSLLSGVFLHVLPLWWSWILAAAAGFGLSILAAKWLPRSQLDAASELMVKDDGAKSL